MRLHLYQLFMLCGNTNIFNICVHADVDNSGSIDENDFQLAAEVIN